ncbi:MAG: putative bifunctional diguanylate cyclase/phosphodiesterase [Tropicimonas sp.]|uniref:putative bifunctional diguanylate cyclase/phosphodiesterase n=1 Tax=Tropicimonas sp. TaxID=2067044 RepID=UPI003A8877CF
MKRDNVGDSLAGGGGRGSGAGRRRSERRMDMNAIANVLSDGARMATSGLGRRLSSVFGALIAAIVLSVIVVNVQTQSQLARDRLDLRITQLLETATESVWPYLIEGRFAQIDATLAGMMEQADIVALFLTDADGVALTGPPRGAGRERDPLAARAMETGRVERLHLPDVERVAKPLQLGESTFGALRFDFDRRSLHAEVIRIWTTNALVGVALVLAGLFTSNIVAARLIRPLNRLTLATERAAGGDLDQTISVRTNDEIESLANSFNTMLVALRGSIQEIHEVAYRDKLTGVPNRAWLSHQLEAIALEAATRHRDFSVLFLDVDDFKAVNDNHGHHVGDRLLVLFAERLRRCVSDLGLSLVNVDSPRGGAAYRFESDAIVARLGGDEFTIVVPTAACRDLAAHVIGAMQEDFEVENRCILATTSIGVANFPDHASSYELLLKHADVAMYQAKRAGRNTFAFYDGDEHKLSLERQELVAEIRAAIDGDQFVIYLQPQFHVATGLVSGAEALVRWQHPVRGVLGPDVFLSVAAGAGLLPEIGRLVVRKTLAAAARILAGADMPLSFAVNLSVDELADEGFVEELLWQIDAANLPPGTIEIEITESTAMTDSAAIERQLERLRKAGTRLAIDDFGVGYSNLGRLKGLAFDSLKLDRSLLQDVGENEEAENLMATILAMAQVMKADVVAEGVETVTQLSVLAKYHCRYFQGYLGGHPMPVGQFLDWLAKGERCGHPDRAV